MNLQLQSIVQLISCMLGCCLAVNPLTVQVFDGVPGQQNPCLGQAVLYECTFQTGRNGVLFTILQESGETNTITVLVGLKVQMEMVAEATLTANFTSNTSAQLHISSATSMVNRSIVSCETVPDTGTQSISIIVIGSTSAPTYSLNSITQMSFSSLSVPVQRSVYGWECIDSYMITAQSINGDTINGSVTVTNPEQLLTTVSLSGMDMCRNVYTLTAVAFSSGERSESFVLTYQADASALSGITTNNLTTQPLTTNLSWSLMVPPLPLDCVTNYTLSFGNSRFIIPDTFVSLDDLMDTYRFPFCTNEALRIAPFIPTLGAVDSSSLTVTTRVEEGFQAPVEVNIADFKLQFPNATSNLFASFRLQWMLRSRGDVTVGYSTGSEPCEPNFASDFTHSHTFSSLNPQEFNGNMFKACVRVQSVDCTREVSSPEESSGISILASRLVQLDENGFQTTVTSTVSISNIHVNVTPTAETLVTNNGNIYVVTISGLQDGITYLFSIQAVDGNENALGIAITGTYRVSINPPCGIGCIIGIIVAVVCMVILVIVGIILCVKFKDKIRRCCHCCCDPDSVDQTDTHQLKSPTDHTSIEHEQAPGGEEYAVVTTAKAKKPVTVDTFYQDPNTIQHEKAPETGDLYAVTERQPKKKSKEAEQKANNAVADLYSFPDKTKKNQQQGLNYAAIDVSSGSGGDKPSNQPLQTEYATVVS